MMLDLSTNMFYGVIVFFHLKKYVISPSEIESYFLNSLCRLLLTVVEFEDIFFSSAVNPTILEVGIMD